MKVETKYEVGQKFYRIKDNKAQACTVAAIFVRAWMVGPKNVDGEGQYKLVVSYGFAEDKVPGTEGRYSSLYFENVLDTEMSTTRQGLMDKIFG